MKRLSGPRTTANLSESVHHQLNMYALAATAAGEGKQFGLACCQKIDAARRDSNPPCSNVPSLGGEGRQARWTGKFSPVARFRLIRGHKL
jgi:hypothetical protein